MSSRRKPSRRGAVVVLVALLVGVLVAMVAFAVDVGYIVHVRTELQRTADSCALAAVVHLPDQTAARTAAQVAAEENDSGLSVSAIAFGRWDRDKAVFLTSLSGMDANAARVTVSRTRGTGNPVRLFWGPAIGTSTADVSATAIAMRDKGLCGPLVGVDWISVPGDPQTDSFNSRYGPYNAATAGDRGSICSDGPIALDGNPVVRGDARSGKGYPVTLSGGAIVTGSRGQRLRPLNLPPVDASQAAVSNDNGSLPLIPKGNSWVSPIDGSGNFLVDGGKTYDMPPGTYYVNNLTLTGQSTLRLSGATTIYVTGKLDTSGGYVINQTKLANNFHILMTGSTATVTAKVAFYGVIYAPNTAVTLTGTADWFGAVTGKNLTFTGSGRAHYDESLNLGEIEPPQRISLVQ